MSRRLLTTCALLFALAGALVIASPASAQTGDEINQLRADYGLAAVALDPALSPAAAEISEREMNQPVAFERREEGDHGMRVCLSCPFNGRIEGDPHGRTLGHGVFRSDWTLERNLRAFPDQAALVLDPRLSAIAGHETNGVETVVFAIDPTVPFGDRLLVYPRIPSAERPEQLRVIAPALSEGRLIVTGVAGRRVYGVPVQAGIGGIGVASFSLTSSRPVLAYSGRYEIGFGGLRASFTTAAAPARADGFPSVVGGRSVERAKIRAFLRSAPAPVRAMLARVGDRIDFRVGLGVCGQFTSCTWPKGESAQVSILNAHLAAPEGRFVVYHELAHALDLVGLDPAGRAALTHAMHGSSRWGCVINPAEVDVDLPRSEWCLTDMEHFADEFARWAVGDRTATGGFSTVSLIAPRAMGRLMARHWSPRPLNMGGWDER